MNIVSIMPVWDEQNMIALSLYSTKNFVTEYIIIIQKGIDKTKEVIEYCKKLWNLNITYIESNVKLRLKRELIKVFCSDPLKDFKKGYWQIQLATLLHHHY